MSTSAKTPPPASAAAATPDTPSTLDEPVTPNAAALTCTAMSNDNTTTDSPSAWSAEDDKKLEEQFQRLRDTLTPVKPSPVKKQSPAGKASQREMEALKQELASARAEADAARAQMSDFQAELASQDGRRVEAAVEAAIVDSQKEMAALKEQLAVAQAEAETAKAQANELEVKLTAQHQRADTAFGELRKGIDALKQQVTFASADAKAIKARTTTDLQEKLTSELSRCIDTVNRRVHMQVEELKKQLEEADAAKAQMNLEVERKLASAREQGDAALKREIALLKQHLASAQHEVMAAEAKCDEYEQFRRA